MQIIILNPEGQVKWDLTISPNIEHNEKFPNEPEFQISETNTEHSLFSNPLTHGDSPGECLDHFLAIEEQLLDSL